MGWEIVAFVGAAIFIMFLVAVVLLMSFVLATAAKREEGLQKANKALAEEIVATREALGKARVPITLSVSDDQIMQLATLVNNVRDNINLPKEQVH